jgi:hypothetical protein
MKCRWRQDLSLLKRLNSPKCKVKGVKGVKGEAD